MNVPHTCCIGPSIERIPFIYAVGASGFTFNHFDCHRDLQNGISRLCLRTVAEVVGTRSLGTSCTLPETDAKSSLSCARGNQDALTIAVSSELKQEWIKTLHSLLPKLNTFSISI